MLGKFSDENNAFVFKNTGWSLPRRYLELGIPQTSLHRTLYKNLGLKGLGVFVEKPLHPQRVSVWCYLCGVIGPCFFKIEVGLRMKFNDVDLDKV